MMLAKFITLCICALLRTNNAAAQLDFGVYKITNRASQSSLCSHEVGGPIYVSMQGHSCARDLWELTPGYEHGLYTITNIGLNSSIRASNTLGAHVIPSNDKTLFAISSNEGHGHIIKYPNIDLVWTVVPTVMSRGDIRLQPESGDDTQLWTFIRIHDTIIHAHIPDFRVQARNSEEESRNLEFLRGIERLGGSVGYQEHLESLHTISNFTHIAAALTSDSYANIVWVTGEVLSFFIYSTLKINTGEYTGKGDAWGLAAGAVKFVGFIKYNSWEEVISAENEFSIVGAGVSANGLLVTFSINGHQVALLTATGLGVSVLLGAGGDLTWTQDT